MIGSFWNLCRACPSMPIDKLHSEYRSTYTWHEYTGPQQEHNVVRRAPQAPQNSRPTLEPPLPRRKKCPELAYRHHEFINSGDGGIDAVDTNLVADKVKEVTGNSTLPPSQLSKAISRISTEYRLQFAWPRRAQLTNGDTVAQVPAAGGAGGNAGGPPRKSLSMGALKQGIGSTGPAPVHTKKRLGDVDHKRDGLQASELEPLFGNNSDTIDGVVPEGDEDLPELKITFRSVTKEEKDKENTRKVAPSMNTMLPAGRPSSVQARPISGILQEDFKTDNERAIARARKDFLIRHHLDRTTGVGDGALLPSPTREKLEPVVPRRRDDSKEARDEIQPKTKSSPKNSPRTGRSQSLGPLSRSPKRQTPRAPSVSKDAKEKEKEHKDKEAKDKSVEPERHPRPMVGGRVRWSIREPSYSSSKSPANSSSTSEPPIPPLPPPPSGPTPLHKKASPKPQRKLTAEPQVNGERDFNSVSTPPPQNATVSVPTATAVITSSPWFDDEPVVKSPPEPTRVKSPEQMIMRSPEPVNWTVPLDTGKTFTVTQNVREGELLTRPHSEAKTWGAHSIIHSAPMSAPSELAVQHKSQQHSQHSGYKSPESESVSLGSFAGLNGHKDLDSETYSSLPSNAQDASTPSQSDKGSIVAVEDTKQEPPKDPAIKPVAGTNLRCLEDPIFEFERGKTESGQASVTPAIPGTGYRILEAQDPVIIPGGAGGSSSSGYHVLEAPDLSPDTNQRSAASDVLEMARNRFDKFWGKNGSENQA